MRNEERTTAAGERTRERVLEEALPLFAEHGFAGTSVRMVAGAAGVNVATLAYHFTDKAGLYDAVIARLYEELATFPLDVQLGGGGDLLGDAIRAGWSFVRGRPTMIRLLHRHLLDQGRHHELALGAWQEPLFDRLRAVVLAVRPEWGEREVRLLVFTVVHLLVRFALDDRAQLARMLAVDEPSLDDAIVAWIRGLVAARLGLVPPPR